LGISGAGFGEDERGEGRDYNAEFEHQQQLHMMAEQDTTLESVFHTVGNLRQQADTMGRELEEQAEMLDTVDNLADRVGGRLQTGLKTMGTVIRKNEDRFSSCCIAVLIFVLILLLILVLVL
jgi:t-SNARE complex subunit (syntaxin)